ncbi:MAG TPA: aminotransferase [Acetobacteraceae bacterium]|nr:aminotransferase [Acetobacteraceae bacterium]
MDTHLPNSTVAQDVHFHIHSQTNPSAFEKDGPIIIADGEGARIRDAAGNTYLDAMAGLWCASLGFANARLTEAAYRQGKKLGFYHTFYGRTTAEAATLAEKLVDLTGMAGGRAYFVTSGSEANETMVKLAWLYHGVRGKPTKRKVIARNGAFHGSTIAAGSMCGLSFMHREFGLPIPGFLHTLAPHPYRVQRPDEDDAAFVQRLCDTLEAEILAEGPETIAAFIAEPVMAGGGIVVPPADYFPRLKAVLDKYDILMLDDEIVCGFARTGNWFGRETVNMQPHMMSLAKGLSSGHFPIAAVVVAPEIYDALVSFNKNGGVFGHGFTNSGHPVGVAVALEAIAIYEEMGIVDHVRRMGARLRGHLDPLAASPIVGNIRGAGLMLGVEIVENKSSRAPFPPARQMGPSFDRIALRNGLVVRCMGDTLGMSPPLIVREAEVDEIAEKFARSLAELERQAG